MPSPFLAVTIRPVPVIDDANWTWHVGLDAEASAIANDLWNGRKVRQERLARILWLGVLEFGDASRVLPRVAGRPVHLALAMDAANRLRMKPQNLVAGLPLTAREWEIAELAARGDSSRDIARRLVLSVRTVEGHLYRIYPKLGIAGRDELPAVMDARVE